MFSQSCGIIGSGFIGKNLQIVFAERGVQVFAYDKNGQKGGEPTLSTPKASASWRSIASTKRILQVVSSLPSPRPCSPPGNVIRASWKAC